MSTFSEQSNLPVLPVPPLKQTLQNYLKSASAILNKNELKNLEAEITKFEESDLAKQLQSALENRAKNYKNWLEDWWYTVYTEFRGALIPNISFGALNSLYTPIKDGQISRSADVLYHWLSVWDQIRNEKWPISSSRGVIWDMVQFHQLFSSNRTPHKPKDTMDRFFKTKSEGDTPHHIIVCCKGTLWKVDILNSNGNLKSVDELYSTLQFIKNNSDDNISNSIVTLTSTNRDVWASNRDELLRCGSKNIENVHDIESSILFLSLVPTKGGSQEEILQKCLLDESWYTWQDKSVSITIYEDGQVLVHGDHSNIDAIVLLQVGDYVAQKVRNQVWSPMKMEISKLPQKLDFELSQHLKNEVFQADVEYQKNKMSYRSRGVLFNGFGNDLCRSAKIYTDTVVQLALQLAFLKTHGFIAPIYETASTRKFYHGRTETVRGCTVEFVKFAKAFLEGENGGNAKKLFDEAVNAHNKLMSDCMHGNGFDRHLLGLKKTLEIMNKGCGPKKSLPSFMEDETWKRAGGDGNFLLSTSFIGYMPNNETGTFGYVSAMRSDGYGCFYRIGKNKIHVAVSDWNGTRSNINAFSQNILWALGSVQQFVTCHNSKI